jgi:putative heme iron utilization protein
MDLTVTIASREESMRILFPRPLVEAKDAHGVLVEMMKEAQAWANPGSAAP